MLSKGLNSPLASAMEVESLVPETLVSKCSTSAYYFEIDENNNLPQLEPKKMWLQMLDDLVKNVDTEIIATRFHLGFARGIVAMVNTICRKADIKVNNIVLSGGVFQNRILLQQVSDDLINQGYDLLQHSTIPANDGGIALGQGMVALAQQSKEHK